MTNFKLKSIMISMLALFATGAFADTNLIDATKSLSATTTTTTSTTPVLRSWMNPDVGSAWNLGYKGQGTTLITVDDFSSTSKFSGNLNGTTLTQRHGEWTKLEASLIAPSANSVAIDYNTSKSAIVLNPGLNVINASYALLAPTGYSVSQINFGILQNSVVADAQKGLAVVTKAAGNYGVAVNGSYQGYTDYMNLALKGAPSAIYVGALNSNGTTTNKATIASYSNTAGTDLAMQSHFLVVGVTGNTTGLYGTSFAAPIIQGYSGILGSKFTTATPTQITNQLLNTARTDTIANYSASVHGKGEASLSRALAPVTIK